MRNLSFSIQTTDPEFTSAAFGSNRPLAGTSVSIGESVDLCFKGERIEKGFSVTTLIVELAIAVPVHITAGLLAHVLYDWLKSRAKSVQVEEKTVRLDAPDAEQSLLTVIEDSSSLPSPTNLSELES